MYVSQVFATLLYTVFKTILLILLNQTIYSICAWMNRYDLAKIFEQGNFVILFGYKKYRKYNCMFLCLFIVIIFEVIIAFLPTIATTFMPFESVIINDGIPKYFQANFSTPIQSVSIPSNDNTMNEYCKDMRLCDTNGKYYNNIVNISKSMTVTYLKIDLSSKNYVNFTNNFCNIYVDKNMQVESHYIYNKTLNLDINIINSNNSNSLSLLISNIMNTYLKYNNNETYIYFNYKNQVYPFIFNSQDFYYISVINRADIVYSDGKNHILLVMKMAIYSDYSSESEYNDIFNNSQLLYDVGKMYEKNSSNIISFTQYIYNDFLVNDFLLYPDLYNFIKVRILKSAYLIVDENFDSKEIFNGYLTTNLYNVSIFDKKDFNNKTSIFNNFNDHPFTNLFMYTILFNSNNFMYGIKGNKEIVADISPVFIGTIVSIIILLIIICVLSRYINNKLYFYTLLETIGISNLPNINNKNEILLDEKNN